ncbi:fkbp-type peptidyl-prolyl cis-trans [Stylonychia lemnae]|uniref:peptidylprolyl isomerase n=1 Tax=Stylonychia lemnae TaxID=5949 RepID=A0A078B5H1_STYLE|nr:fkbp-type peptidyl-prolyl cis-trans [Stylonychia lemnae]|eukprot:CDW89770.1 fkbp-type peptidyl-prolyl cis-trans [Stylonychia lemnae]
MAETHEGFKVEKLNEGSGPNPSQGQTVKVHYTGKLTDGSVFDSSVQRGQPFSFKLGVGQVISCWDQGIAQLQKGQEVVLTCPYQMAYGERGHPPVIPAKATLIFEVQLLDFQ